MLKKPGTPVSAQMAARTEIILNAFIFSQNVEDECGAIAPLLTPTGSKFVFNLSVTVNLFKDFQYVFFSV